MIRRRHSIDADYFEGLYRAEDDPWGFATSAYEHAKYDATLAALGTERSHRALEVGCAIGVLTARLAAATTSLQWTSATRRLPPRGHVVRTCQTSS
jgi:cyclopropane fatty-acyl-phospholipid synthase-like methyltransferase